jgi:hypothetical protein
MSRHRGIFGFRPKVFSPNPPRFLEGWADWLQSESGRCRGTSPPVSVKPGSHTSGEENVVLDRNETFCLFEPHRGARSPVEPRTQLGGASPTPRMRLA